MDEIKKEENTIKPQTVKIIKTLPMVALRGKVLFPKILLNFDVGRPMSISAINRAGDFDGEIFIASQKNALIDAPLKKEICTVGVVAKVLQVIKMPGDNMKVKVEALYRAKIKEYVKTDGYFIVTVEQAPYTEVSAVAMHCFLRALAALVYKCK